MFVGLWGKEAFRSGRSETIIPHLRSGGRLGNPDPTNISLLTEQRQRTALLTWRLWVRFPPSWTANDVEAPGQTAIDQLSKPETSIPNSSN